MRWLALVAVVVVAGGCKDAPLTASDTRGAADATCGNGILEGDETCDGNCTPCDDNNACTRDTSTGGSATCDLRCTRETIDACESGDGCCPAGCTTATDDDCSATCGDGIIDPNETCDPPGSCATACNDGNACTGDVLTGSAQNCNAQCATLPVNACVSGDACCPLGCTNASDGDCLATCGNGVLEDAETCDPKSTCPTTCNDGNACTMNVMTGSVSNCTASCSYSNITACAGGDGCCPAACTYTSDTDCPPPASTPLPQRITVTNIATPAGVIAGTTAWRIWGTGSLKIGPVFTVPFADCGTLVGYTTGTATAPRALVARLDAADQLVTTYDLGAFVLRGLAAEPDGHWAALLWEQDVDPETSTLYVKRYSVQGAALWTTSLDDALAAPTDFDIGESRLEYGAGSYAAYFHVHGISGFADGHEGDALHWLDAMTGARTLGWNWGCSHSMSELLRFSSAANLTLPVCVTDCYPGSSSTGNSIGGIYLNHDEKKVRDVDANCGGKVAGELGSLAPGVTGWKLVFNAHQNNATTGNNSYNPNTNNQDIGFVSIANTKTPGTIVWLTSGSANEANSSIARWRPAGDAAEQYVVGWTVAGTTPQYKLARVSAAGTFLEQPVTITAAKWGERDDPFRDHYNGDVVWAWFDTAGSSTLRFARLRSGGTATCNAL